MSQSESQARHLTLRGFEPELERRIREVARKERLSLNQAALKLLRRGAGLSPGEDVQPTIGHALDHLAGTWTEEEARQFEESVAVFETIDESLWT